MERSPQRRIRPVVRCPADWPLSLSTRHHHCCANRRRPLLVQGFADRSRPIRLRWGEGARPARKFRRSEAEEHRGRALARNAFPIGAFDQAARLYGETHIPGGAPAVVV